MKKYAYSDPSPSRNIGSMVWSVLTVLTLLLTVGVVGIFLIIYTGFIPTLNPFPAPSMPPPAHLPTETPTDIVYPLPPTWTPTLTPVSSATWTPLPSATLPDTPTPITITPSPTTSPLPPPPPAGGYPFEVRKGNPKAIPNIYHPELECKWMGVGGQVIDMSNAPVIGLIIQLGGVLPRVKIPENTMSLTGLALSYGRSGYEFKLSDLPIPSRGLLWVQLLNQSGGPLSDKVYFDTYDNCDQNLVIIDFVQVHK
jgi:type VI secretion system secreted protein VgrG